MADYKFNEITKKIIVELKATRNYLRAHNMQIALLINFGSISLPFESLENPKFKENTFSY
jgi:hypothetical protein